MFTQISLVHKKNISEKYTANLTDFLRKSIDDINLNFILMFIYFGVGYLII